MENQIVDKLVELHEFDAPESIVKKVTLTMFDDIKKRYKGTPQEAEADRMKFEDMAPGLKPIAEKTVRWEIIKSRIINEEKIEIEDYDIAATVESQAAATKQSADVVKSHLLKNDAFVNHILSNKVISLLIDFASTNEISFDDIPQNFDHEHYDDYEDEHDLDHDHHDHEHGHHHHDHDHKH